MLPEQAMNNSYLRGAIHGHGRRFFMEENHMTKKEKIAAEIEKAKQKRQELKERIRDLEKQYKEEETLEFLHLVQESELSFDDITELIRGNMLFGKDKAKEKKGDQNV